MFSSSFVTYIVFLFLYIGYCICHRLPIVYFYTVNENACTRGLPNYLIDTLQQAIDTQPDCDVYLISNEDLCLKTHNVSLLKDFPETLHIINFDDIKSNKSAGMTKK